MFLTESGLRPAQAAAVRRVALTNASEWAEYSHFGWAPRQAAQWAVALHILESLPSFVNLCLCVRWEFRSHDLGRWEQERFHRPLRFLAKAVARLVAAGKGVRILFRAPHELEIVRPIFEDELAKKEQVRTTVLEGTGKFGLIIEAELRSVNLEDKQ